MSPQTNYRLSLSSFINTLPYILPPTLLFAVTICKLATKSSYVQIQKRIKNGYNLDVKREYIYIIIQLSVLCN